MIENNKINSLSRELVDHDLFNHLSSLFKIFSDPTRIRIIYLLKDNKLCVQDLANILNATQSNISHQLSILKAHNVVKYIRDKKNIYYILSDEHIESLLDIGIEHVKEKNLN